MDFFAWKKWELHLFLYCTTFWNFKNENKENSLGIDYIQFYFVLPDRSFSFKIYFAGSLSKVFSGSPEPDLRCFCEVLRNAKTQFYMLNKNNNVKMLMTSKH